ncbi:MAG: alpha/beta hydrolase [Verrucomicrobiota bacterium]
MKCQVFLLAIVFSLGILGANGQGAGGNAAKTVIPPEVEASLEAHEGLTYARYGDREMQLDLYRPKDAAGEALPAIVCIHGGGWWKGDRRSHGNLAKALAARGYVAVTISYRLSGEKRFPAAIEDCKAAVRWLRANTEAYGIDPDKIGAIGLSAGGHLTALLATSGGVEELEGGGGNAEERSDIQAAVPMGAQTHLMSARNKERSAEAEIWQQFLGGSQAEEPERYRLASPMAHLDAEDAPMLLLTGENDDPSTHGEEIRAKMDALGVASGFKAIDGAPHGFIGRQEWFDVCIEEAGAFFDEHLK